MKNLVGDQGSVPPAQNNTHATAGGQKGNPNQQTAHLGHSYVTFLRGSSEQMRQVVTDEVWVNDLFEASD